MSRKGHTLEFKLRVLDAYENKHYTLNEILKEFGIHDPTLMRWKRTVEKYGKQGLKTVSGNKTYSKETKLAAITDYESGQYSLRQVIEKYEISSTSVLRKWIKDYNGHRERRVRSKGSSHSMAKGRKTTWKERIEIVQDALANGKNYHQASKIHQVSYQQVYQWVRKYEAGDWDALKDRRGRSKSEEELTAEEKMKLEIRRIEKDNERLRAENAFLKKLEEIERRRR